MSEAATPELITVRTEGRVGIVTLNRPKALNALNDQLMNELGAALKAFDADGSLKSEVVGEEALAAGRIGVGALASGWLAAGAMALSSIFVLSNALRLQRFR